jgi:hypothetical protein
LIKYHILFLRYSIYPSTITKCCDTFVIWYHIRRITKYDNVSYYLILFSFYIETNNDTGEKSVRLKIIDMDDIDEDPPKTGMYLFVLFLSDKFIFLS